MKFIIKIRKWPNFYFFVQNLSNWHFSCETTFNTEWQEDVGSLSSLEKNALKRIKLIHQRFSFGHPTPLFVPFLTKGSPWPTLKQWLSPQDFVAIHSTFKIFEPRFNTLNQNHAVQLKQWQQFLQKNLNTQQPKADIIKFLSNLYFPTDQNFKRAPLQFILLFQVLSHYLLQLMEKYSQYYFLSHGYHRNRELTF